MSNLTQKRRVISVSQVNKYVRMILEEDVFLSDVFIRGEVSNFKSHGSGHWYFTLKDDDAALSCVMFRGYVPSFTPADGMSVIIGGYLTLYEKTGQYQLFAKVMEPLGAGALALAFEQLRDKLAAEGLFAPERKRPIPPFARCVAVVTSPTGAAVKDIITVARSRNPLTEIVVVPALVQGRGAAADIVRALAWANAWGKADVIILGRGGGSIEDLWPFNEETVARAVYGSKTPVISAVGHETDFTIADYAADLRAPTPTAAAHIAVPDYAELRAETAGYFYALNRALTDKLVRQKERLRYLANRPALNRPLEPVLSARARSETLNRRISSLMDGKIENAKANLRGYASALEHLSPLRTLERGFAIVENGNGDVLSSAESLTDGMEVRLLFADGCVGARVVEKP